MSFTLLKQGTFITTVCSNLDWLVITVKIIWILRSAGQGHTDPEYQMGQRNKWRTLGSRILKLILNTANSFKMTPVCPNIPKVQLTLNIKHFPSNN